MKQKTITTLYQLVRFGVAGGLNTLLDWGILNLLTTTFNVYSGELILVFNIFSVSAALVNSYILNKYWTFRATGQAKTSTQIGKFLAVSIVGIVINSAIVYVVTTIIGVQFGLAENHWALAAKMLATGVVFIWNFIGYKLWAFAKKEA
ncbi:GtrA family protein [Patescibacteria group bacterium]|nr:GtrA family protein [Patescibacteria group bacterium]